MTQATEATVRALPMDRVHPDPTQPRKEFAAESIAELAASIRENGLIQPITVRPDGKGWIIVAGERRWRAHLHNKTELILARIIELSGADVLVHQIVENAQRADMTPLEEARAYQRLVDDLAGNIELAAKRLGKPKFRLTERLCLLRLAPEYQQLLAARQLKCTEAFEMAGLSPAGQHRLFTAIKSGQCPTVKALRAVSQALLVQEAQASIFDRLAVPAAPPPSAEERAAASRLEQKILQVTKMLAMGFHENEIIAAKRVDPGKAATFADKLALIRKHLTQMELALRASAVAGDLFQRSPTPE